MDGYSIKDDWVERDTAAFIGVLHISTTQSLKMNQFFSTFVFAAILATSALADSIPYVPSPTP